MEDSDGSWLPWTSGACGEEGGMRGWANGESAADGLLDASTSSRSQPFGHDYMSGNAGAQR